MVHFITGDINSGKTTRMTDLYQARGGEGFVMVKHMRKDMVHSYSARCLSTGEERLLVLRDCFLTEGFEEVCRIGPYCFSAGTLEWVETTVKAAVDKGKDCVYLDEIGVLELEGQGFADLLTYLVVRVKTLYLTARNDLIETIVNHFGIESYDVLDPGNPYNN